MIDASSLKYIMIGLMAFNIKRHKGVSREEALKRAGRVMDKHIKETITPEGTLDMLMEAINDFSR